MVFYDDLTLMEVDLIKKQVVNEINLADLEETSSLAGQKATAFAMFKELNMIAVATDQAVHLFDYVSEGSDEIGLTLVRSMNVPNVSFITFIELYIVIMTESEENSEASIACYQLDGEEPDSTI